MRKNILLALALGVLAAPAIATAQDRSYSYVEGGYQYADVDGYGKASDGLYLGGSYEVKDSGFYVKGKYTRLDYKYGVDADQYDVGVGYYHTLNTHLDVLGEAEYNYFDTKYGHADNYVFGAGVRGSFSPSWEGVAKVRHYTGGDMSGSNTTGLLGVQYKVNSTWGVTGDVESDGDVSLWQVGVRASF